MIDDCGGVDEESVGFVQEWINTYVFLSRELSFFLFPPPFISFPDSSNFLPGNNKSGAFLSSHLSNHPRRRKKERKRSPEASVESSASNGRCLLVQESYEILINSRASTGKQLSACVEWIKFPSLLSQPLHTRRQTHKTTHTRSKAKTNTKIPNNLCLFSPESNLGKSFPIKISIFKLRRL